MERQYITVFALNKYIKAKMNQDVSLQSVYIKGEISNYRPHPSGHLYFTLKDEHSRINAIMFASLAKQLHFKIENGMQVFIHASVSVYEVSGQYQLYVKTMEPDGIGQLFLKYETLKKKLYQEGLFDEAHKKKIPAFPKSIAVLSAKQGAALQDIIRTVNMRFSFTKVIVFPIPVQGKNAYLSIIDTLRQVDRLGFDTIILARGGGSIEDLWNFNEEALARCIYECHTPIITGIGHETDFTICDFVSDCRCATPTAAAMKATPDQKELRVHQQELYQQLIYKMNHCLDYHYQKLKRIQQSYYFSNPEVLYSHEILRLTHLQDRLCHQIQIFDLKNYQLLQNYQKQLKQCMDLKFQQHHAKFQQLLLGLDNLSPLKIMQRGYSLVYKDDQMVKSAETLKSHDEITIRFYDGQHQAIIK